MLSPRSIELVEAVDDLTMRGGKRLRPIVAAAAMKAVDSEADAKQSAHLGAALELLQSYLLIHDDWMDLDETRRGGPSVYAMMQSKYDDQHLGASLAILAGDLASAYANEILSTVPFPTEHRERAQAAFWKMQREVFFGQHLDVVADPDVERMYDLKTGSYTVRGPLVLGGMLAGATNDELLAFERFAAPLGVAFQLRDELLGTFGDSAVTGKPAGNDIRAGKLTFAVKFAKERLDGAKLEVLVNALGNSAASDPEIESAANLLIETGAKQQVEKRLADLTQDAEQAVETSGLSNQEPLQALVKQLTVRAL